MKRIGDFEFIFKGQSLILTPEKTIFWKEKKALILSDLHLGKAGHFRKAGIAVPRTLNDANLDTLDLLVKDFRPSQIFFLGDLFHSEKNEEWNSFNDWRYKHSEIHMLLAIGNHDFHPTKDYEKLDLQCSKLIHMSPFLLVHDVLEIEKKEDSYPISGHVHPSIKLTGKGRQSSYLPCFYFGENFALLPAFGTFTGNHTIKPLTSDKIFAVADQQIIQIL